MNAAPALADWGQWLLRLALGSAAIIVLAALAVRWIRSAGWQRTLWRGCLLGLAIFVLGESVGGSDVLSFWMQGSRADEPMAEPLPALPQAPRAQHRIRLIGPGPMPERIADELEPERVAGSLEPASGVWWPGLVWLAGSGLLLARFGIGQMLLVLLRRRCQRLTGGGVVARVHAVAGRLGIRRRITILEARTALGPATFGVWRPTLILPRDFDKDFGEPAQEAMLAHELAHLAARDTAWHGFTDLVAALLWWQPLVWWTRSRLHAAGEAAADDASLVIQDGPQLLASSLVELGKRLTQQRRPAWLAAAGNGFRSGLGRRVERLLRLGTNVWQPPRRRHAACLLALLTLMLGGGCLFATSWAQTHIFSEGDQTMKHGSSTWKRSLAGIVLFSTFGVGAEPAWAQAAQDAAGIQKPGSKKPDGPAGIGVGVRAPAGPEGGQPGPAAAEAEGDGRQILKVYRLTQRDPEVIANIAHMLLTGEPLPQPGGGEGGMPPLPGGPAGGFPGPGGPGAGGPGPGFPGGGGLGGARGAAPGGFRGMPKPGIGGFAPGPPGPGPGIGAPGAGFGAGLGGPVSSIRFAPDKRSGTLIVRGDKHEVDLVTELVAVLDAPANKAPKTKHLYIVRLKHADPKVIGDAFHKLDIQVRQAVDPHTRSLILLPHSPDGDLQEIRQIVEALDVAVPEPPKK